jgi:dTDP-4-amino-4,6-dideoxygalactose transaminase
VHVRKKLDIAWSDLAYGAVRSAFSGNAAALEWRLEDFWSPGGDALACLSVRTGFDLLLQALALPSGSEILVSAVTIRDMVRIIEHHGLAAAPLDLDMDSLSVRAGDIARRAGPRTRALLVAHLFGSRMPMEPLIRAARSRGLLVIEDCAQAYDGAGYRGHPESDVSMFSFGPIKTATALGGALLRVRDAALLARMRRLQGEYPRQSRLDYLVRVAKYSGLKLLSARLPYTLFVAACRLLGRNHDAVIGGAARSFAGEELFAAIRRRPAGALLALLSRRLRRFDQRAIGERAALAGALFAQVPGVARPGARAEMHTHWVVPVCSPAPEELLRQLWRGGFDATRGTSSLYVAPPAPGEAGRVMAQVVYVPLNPRMGAKAIAAIGKILSNDRPRGDSRCYEKTFPT